MIQCLLLLPLYCGGGVFIIPCLCCAVLNTVSSLAIISLEKRELVTLLYLLFWCHVTVSVLCLFLAMTWVIVVFSWSCSQIKVRILKNLNPNIYFGTSFSKVIGNEKSFFTLDVWNRMQTVKWLNVIWMKFQPMQTRIRCRWYK